MKNYCTNSHVVNSHMSNIEISAYLVHVHNRYYRNCLTKYRVSDRQLEIETGTHKKKDRNDRLCNIMYVTEVTIRTKFIFCSTVQLIKVSEIHSLKPLPYWNQILRSLVTMKKRNSYWQRNQN